LYGSMVLMTLAWLDGFGLFPSIVVTIWNSGLGRCCCSVNNTVSLSLACSVQYACAVVLFNWCWSVCGGRWLTCREWRSMLQFSLNKGFYTARRLSSCSLDFKVVVLMPVFVKTLS
jgi:hypothetical protein